VSYCRTPMKKRFANPRLASESLERVAAREVPGAKRPIRIYECADHWHTTSIPAEEFHNVK
jgi:hypothetical protein